ncbi:tyrosine-protein phosphatase 10D-like [Dendronephthya gigantea]|uniref:tyrosine-protein phosphatase 10D-like n=1 Tax=Dendronephthya gigantea TaxID=151771 RepID=UPI00106AD8D2|nr:tyrosine-protein phosphatase 10D-like [Dendronephthya gigantea]
MKLVRGSKDLKANTTQNSVLSSLVYRINVTNTDDIGDYKCIARNKLKSEEIDITLSVPLDRPEIKDVKPTCDGVSFSWAHDKRGYIVVEEYEVTVRQSADRKLVKVSLLSSNTSQKTFSGLDENTDYELAVKQKTKVENIGLKATKVTTTTTCPLKEIRNATINENSVTLYWPEVPKDNVEYIIEYGINDQRSREKTNKIYWKISDLDYGKTYKFQVFYQLGGIEKPLTDIRNISIPPRPPPTPTPTEDLTTTKRSNMTTSDPTTERLPPGQVARKKGLSGGAIAAIVIVIILLVLIAVDIFCCFFNHCGVVHMCAAACSGKGREKYTVDGSPEEGTKLKEVNEEGKEDPGA